MRADSSTSALRQPVEQRALSGIRIADQRNGRHRHRLAPLALLPADAAHRFQVAAQLHQPPLNAPAVGFELGFARTSRADAAAQLRHGRAAPGKPRQHVFQLRQLHLQMAFARPRMAGKDIQDELRAIHHAGGQLVLQVPQLRR